MDRDAPGDAVGVRAEDAGDVGAMTGAVAGSGVQRFQPGPGDDPTTEVDVVAADTRVEDVRGDTGTRGRVPVGPRQRQVALVDPVETPRRRRLHRGCMDVVASRNVGRRHHCVRFNFGDPGIGTQHRHLRRAGTDRRTREDVHVPVVDGHAGVAPAPARPAPPSIPSAKRTIMVLTPSTEAGVDGVARPMRHERHAAGLRRRTGRPRHGTGRRRHRERRRQHRPHDHQPAQRARAATDTSAEPSRATCCSRSLPTEPTRPGSDGNIHGQHRSTDAVPSPRRCWYPTSNHWRGARRRRVPRVSGGPQYSDMLRSRNLLDV